MLIKIKLFVPELSKHNFHMALLVLKFHNSNNIIYYNKFITKIIKTHLKLIARIINVNKPIFRKNK